jgi:hypothetical protein
MNISEYYQNNEVVCDVWSTKEYHKPNTWVEWERQGIPIEIWSGSILENIHLEDLEGDKWVIFKYIEDFWYNWEVVSYFNCFVFAASFRVSNSCESRTKEAVTLNGIFLFQQTYTKILLQYTY